MRPSLAVRVSRVTVPIVMVGVLGLGVAAATWPGDETQVAYPAPAAQPALVETATPEVRELEEPTTTPTSTPTPTAKPSPTRTPSAKPSAKPKAVSQPRATTKPAAKPVAKAKPKPVAAPPLKVTDTKYATASLNVRAGADFESEVVDVVSTGDKVSVTSAVRNGFRFISHNDRGRWISDKYLSDSKPVVPSSPSESSGSGSSSGGSSSSSSGISAAACSKSTSIQSGLTPNAIKVYRALCARYSSISSFGGRRAGDSGFHGTGRAVDVMISNSSVGWEIAEWTRANAGTLGISEVIYYQKIWTVERSSEGWRPMSDRGSASANHFDHVHVSVY